MAKASGSKPRTGGDRREDRHGEQHDGDGIDQATEHEPDRHHDQQNAPGSGAGAEQETLAASVNPVIDKHARIELRAKQQQQQRTAGAADIEHHMPDFARLDALDDREDERADRADAGAFGRRAQAEPDRAQRAENQRDDQQRADEHGADRCFILDRESARRTRRRHPRRARLPSGKRACFADQLGLELRRDHHIDDHSAGREQPGNNAGQEQLADRQFGEHAPDDHQHRRRDQHSETGAAGDAAEREIAPIAVAPHFRIGDARERGGGRDAHAGDEAEQGIGRRWSRRQAAPAAIWLARLPSV